MVFPGLLDAAHVVVHAGEQVPGAAAGEEADRLLHKAAEQLPAEVEHDALADRGREERLEDADQTGADGRRHSRADDQGELREAAARLREVVDQRLGHESWHQSQAGADGDALDHDQRPTARLDQRGRSRLARVATIPPRRRHDPHRTDD